MFDPPQTHYAKGPEGDIAYQVVGDGPMDLVVVPGWFSHIDLQWDDPLWRAYIGELASFARVILYDKRGTGLSDPVDGVPTVENRVDDLRAVMDAAGSERAALFGYSEGGPISLLFAATYPERVRALILYVTGVVSKRFGRAGPNSRDPDATSQVDRPLGRGANHRLGSADSA